MVLPWTTASFGPLPGALDWSPMRLVLATFGLLLTDAALAQTPLSPPQMPTQPQLAPQTPLAPGPQLPPDIQAPQQPAPSVPPPQLRAEKPLPQTPQLSPPAPPAPLAPLSQAARTMDGGTGPSSTVSFPSSPPGGVQPRRDGGP